MQMSIEVKICRLRDVCTDDTTTIAEKQLARIILCASPPTANVSTASVVLSASMQQQTAQAADHAFTSQKLKSNHLSAMISRSQEMESNEAA